MSASIARGRRARRRVVLDYEHRWHRADTLYSVLATTAALLAASRFGCDATAVALTKTSVEAFLTLCDRVAAAVQ